MNKTVALEIAIGVFALGVAAFGLAAHAKAADAVPAQAVCVEKLSANTEEIAKLWLSVGAVPVEALPAGDPLITAAFDGQAIPAPKDLGLTEIKGWIIDAFQGQYLAHPFDDDCISLLSVPVADPTAAAPAPSSDPQSLPFSGTPRVPDVAQPQPKRPGVNT